MRTWIGSFFPRSFVPKLQRFLKYTFVFFTGLGVAAFLNSTYFVQSIRETFVPSRTVIAEPESDVAETTDTEATLRLIREQEKARKKLETEIIPKAEILRSLSSDR